ncbi:hypothetical protein [Kribbella hippodromi]|uniref:hypothetical protein n=1 Tax=Kribbella hippodromi TaxID=434347 RepID=UPI0031DDD127
MEPSTDAPADQASATSRYTELVARHDKEWDATAAAVPPGRLPASADLLGPDVIETLHPDVRRVLEYQGAAEYIAAEVNARPWLEPVVDASPAVQRIYTAIDRGNGHAHIRHGPMGTDQLYADRVARLEDPAQTDPHKRTTSIDGLDDSKQHYCAKEATRIHNPEAFVAAFAAAVKHPDVRRALDAQWSRTDRPEEVAIPIAELLGPRGHEDCSGFRLAGDWTQAKRARKAWTRARVEGQDLTDIPQPKVERIPTFEGGTIVFHFAGNAAAERYEIVTMYPAPPVSK